MHVNEENKELIMNERDLNLALINVQQGHTKTLNFRYEEGDPFINIEKITFTNEKEEKVMDKLTARQILEGMLAGEIAKDSEWVSQKPKKYYLRDSFLNNDYGNNYLNFDSMNGVFILESTTGGEYHKTKFTDKDIEELEIPIERFEKIEVED